MAKKRRQVVRRLTDLPELVAKGEIEVINPEPAVPNLATMILKESGEEIPKPGDTIAGRQQYDEFFGLYAQSLRLKKAFRPLGFIPGPAVILDFREGGEVRILGATPDVAREIEAVPTSWMAWEKLPERVRQALDQWKAVVDGLGYEPSPYNLGIAKRLLESHAPAKHLTMVMPRFRYRPGDPEKPFGVTLLPVLEKGELKGLKVKTYNPEGIPDVPAESAVLTLEEVRDGRGPVQKLVRSWALLETNYLQRYDRESNRRQSRPGQWPPKFRRSG